MTDNSRDISTMSFLGMSPTEVRIYLALLELGPSRAGAILKYTGLQNSVVHLTLGKLAHHGFVSYIRRGKLKVYQAASPSYLLSMMDERRQKIEALLPYLNSVRSKGSLPEAEVYEGLNGLKNMCYKLIEQSQPGDEFLFFAFSSKNPAHEEAVYGFYREYTAIRMQRGLKLRGIAHESRRARFKEHKWPHENIRFVDFPTLKSMSICGDRVIIVPWEETQTSFLITSSSFASNCRDYFNEVWSTTAERRA